MDAPPTTPTFEVDIDDDQVAFFHENGYLLVEPVDTSAAVPVPTRAGGASFHHPRTLQHSRPNTTDRDRRAYANEYQTRPVERDVPPERPWITEGRKAFEARTVFQP